MIAESIDERTFQHIQEKKFVSHNIVFNLAQ